MFQLWPKLTSMIATPQLLPQMGSETIAAKLDTQSDEREETVVNIKPENKVVHHDETPDTDEV